MNGNCEKRNGNTMKLFEIPVYALSKKALEKRVEKSRQKIRFEGTDSQRSKETIKRVIQLETFPQCMWEYNHIIGFIVISQDSYDVILDWYAPEPSIQKYYWHSQKKIFLQNKQLGGQHFYIGNMKNGEQLRTRLNELVKGFARTLSKKGYYADLEAFNNIDALLDYERLLKG